MGIRQPLRRVLAKEVPQYGIQISVAPLDGLRLLEEALRGYGEELGPVGPVP